MDYKIIVIFDDYLAKFLSDTRHTMVGCVVQRYNIGLWPACFRCSALDLQLMGDHLCG